VFWEPDEGIAENPRLRDIASIYGYRDWSGDTLFSVIQKESEGASLIIVHGADLAKYDMSQGQRKNITTTLLRLSQLAIRLNAAIVVDSEFPAEFLDPQHESLVDSYFRAWKHDAGFCVSLRADYGDDNERLRDGRELGGEQFYAEFEKGALTRKPYPRHHEYFSHVGDPAKEVTKALEQDGGREIEMSGESMEIDQDLAF
jgi:hypothetical protein